LGVVHSGCLPDMVFWVVVRELQGNCVFSVFAKYGVLGCC